ncbi:MAG: cell division protein FtsW, partial [Myxococcales bacterium]|nr:cell division protein FtsW [Myxococcales bacterium]
MTPGLGCERAPAEDASARAQPASGARRMDPWLFFATLALSCLGLVMVYSSSAAMAHTRYGDWMFYLRRQGAFLGLGVGVLLAVSRIDYRILRRLAKHLMVLGLAGLVLVLMIGTESHGARRWLQLGVSVQPSEIAKLALAVFLSATLARQGERVRKFKTGFLPVMGVAALTMLLVLLEKDLGTTILLGALTLIALYIAGTRLTYVAAATLIAAPLVWQQIVGVSYRRGRVIDFLSGEHSFQIKQSLITIGSGGAFGLGLGSGRQKLGFLPENHTDFILASIGEELGFAGICLVIGLYGLLVWRGLTISRDAPDRFGAYLAICLTALFGLQALIN